MSGSKPRAAAKTFNLLDFDFDFRLGSQDFPAGFPNLEFESRSSSKLYAGAAGHRFLRSESAYQSKDILIIDYLGEAHCNDHLGAEKAGSEGAVTVVAPFKLVP